MVQTVKNLPAMQETWVRFLGCKDSLEKEMATHPSICAWRIPMDRGAWQATVHGVQRVRHDWAANTFMFKFIRSFQTFSEWLTILHSIQQGMRSPICMLNSICYCHYFFKILATPWGIWDLRSPTRDQTHAPSTERQSLNHWTARKSPFSLLFSLAILIST